jgi:U4/U6 small nuclear ribonucleoprotein PRP4
MKVKGSLADQLRDSQELHSVAVPTNDVDVKRMLRSLGHPICFFGEDPKDRRDRLRHLLATADASASVVKGDPQPTVIPKYEVGGDEIAEFKRFAIAFSIPRSQGRIQTERGIDRERIDECNSLGRRFANYTLIASELADRRPLTRLAVANDVFAVAALSGNVSVYSANSMEMLATQTLHSNRVCDVGFVSPNVVVSGSADQSICVWNAEAGEIAKMEIDGIVHSVAVHPSSRVVVAGLSDGTFAVIDIDAQKVIARMQSNEGIVPSVSCHPDGGLVYVGGTDRVGRLWDLRSLKSLKVLQGHEDRITCSKFDSGFHVVTGSADHSMICWDLRNLTRSKRVAGHLSVISSLDIHGDLLLSASFDLSLKMWSMLDFRSYLTIKDCPSPVVGVAFAPAAALDPPLIISAARDGSWRFYHNDII